MCCHFIIILLLLGFFTSHKHHERKISSDIPQPTSQFKSYRKVAGNSAIGGGGSGAILFTPNLFTNHQTIEHFPPIERSNSIASSIASSINIEKPQTSVAAAVEKIESNTPCGTVERTPKPVLFTSHDDEINHNKCKSNLQHIDEIRKSYKTSPHNYIHASNPNLVEFDFPTAKAIDFSVPKIHSPNNWDVPLDASKPKFTLKDLMLQKQKEEAQDMYNKRVFRGVEKSGDTLKKKLNDVESTHVPIAESNGANGGGGGDAKINKIQKRSLPITPDYAQSFKPDDQDILYTRSREGQKLRDFGYELISGDDNNTNQQQQHKVQPLGDTSSSWSAKRNDRIVPGGSTKKKSFNWISSSTDKRNDDEKSSIRSGSFKKLKGKQTMSKFDNLKASSEKIFQFKSNNVSNDRDNYNKNRQADKVLNNVMSYGKGHNAATNYDDSPVFSLMSTSSTDYKNNAMQVQSMRKNSAPERVSYFSKISFPSHKAVPKDKTLLGSPRLHRALFGRSTSIEQHNSNFAMATDHEIFSPVVFPYKVRCNRSFGFRTFFN
jgi:connector enhancer of kinase suppressor of Ras 2